MKTAWRRHCLRGIEAATRNENPQRRGGWWLAVVWSCLVLLGLPGRAAVPLPEAPFHFHRANARQVSMLYQVQHGFITVLARLNGHGPYRFILDTGCATSFITDPSLKELLGIQPGKTYSIAGVGKAKPLMAYQSAPVRVSFGGVEAPAFPFVLFSGETFNLGSCVGVPIHGILGYDLFRSFVVTVEPTLGRLTFTNPQQFQPPKGKQWTSLPLALEDSKPYITTTVALSDSLALPLKLIVDTGADHALSLETYSDTRMRLPAQRLRSELGRGFSGTIMGCLGRITGLRLGNYQLHSLLTSFPDSSNFTHRIQAARNGNLGLGVLRRFDMIIDYEHNRLWLRPNTLQDEAFEYNMSGVQLAATGPQYRQYTITYIEPNSSAAAAGLQPADELLAIDVFPASTLSMAEINKLFRSEDGRTLALIVRRNGELFSTTLHLKRQI